MPVDLDELDLELGALRDRRAGSEVLELALAEHDEVVEVHVRLAREEEAPLRHRLELLQPHRAGADERRGDRRGELDPVRLRARAGDERAQPPLDIDRRRRLRVHDAVAAARRALARHDLARPVGDVLPRHLDEAERRDLDDVRLRPVALELAAQRLLDGRPVLRVRHVDEVDDDDAADVAQPQLADDLLHGLEVVLRDRVLEPAARVLAAGADEAARVHVDDRERLRVVEDEVTARGKIDAAAERRLDLLLDAEVLHQRRLLLVADDALDHVRRGLLEIARDALERLVVVDVGLLEVAGEEVAGDAQRQLGLLVDELGRRGLLRLRLDGLPEPLQEDEVALDVLLGCALGGGAHDQPALLHAQLLQDVLQALALVVVEPARHAEPFALRDEDDEPAGQGDLRRQARALRLHRILDRLDEERLPPADQILDLAAVAALELGADDLVDVEEAVLLEADLDERGLHPRQDVVDLPEIDVARDRAALGPLEVDLGDLVVLEHGDPLLADVDRDDQLALGLGQRRPARRLAAAAAALVAPALLALRERLPVAARALGLAGRGGLASGLVLFLGLLGLLGGRACAARARGLLAPAPAAAAAAPLGPRGIGCGRAFGGGCCSGPYAPVGRG